MNKKLLMTVLVGVMAMALVSAGIMAYYGQVNANIDVTQPISVTVDGQDITGGVFTDALSVTAGETETGASIVISNSADTVRNVVISEVVPAEGIEADYGLIICVASLPDGSLSEEVETEATEGTEGTQITVPAGGSCWFSISYDTDSMLTDGTYTVKTRVEPAGFIIE